MRILKRISTFFLIAVIIVSVFFSGMIGVKTDRAEAAISFVRTISNITNGGTTVTATFPSGATAGNMIIAICGARVSSALSISAPAGFSTAINQAGTPSQGIFYKVAVGGETAITCSSSVSTRLGLHIYEYSGIDPISPIAASNFATGTGVSVSSGSVSASATMIVLAGVVANTSTAITAWSNSFTQRNAFINGGTTGTRSVYGGSERSISALGTYSTVATIGASSAWRGQIVALNQAPPPMNALLTQKNFIIYENVNSITPITPLTAENTVGVGIRQAEVVRLRINVAISVDNLQADLLDFKLQYAPKGVALSCTDVTSGNFVDVGLSGSGSIWRGYDNLGVTDGVTLPSTLLSGSTVTQTYEEINPSSLNPNAVPLGGVAEWDWVIQNNGAPSNSTYCFRMIRTNGDVLSGYERHAEIQVVRGLTLLRYRWRNDDGGE